MELNESIEEVFVLVGGISCLGFGGLRVFGGIGWDFGLRAITSFLAVDLCQGVGTTLFSRG